MESFNIQFIFGKLKKKKTSLHFKKKSKAFIGGWKFFEIANGKPFFLVKETPGSIDGVFDQDGVLIPLLIISQI